MTVHSIETMTTLGIYAVATGSLAGVMYALSRLLAGKVSRATWSASPKRVVAITGRLVLAVLAVGGGYGLYLRFPAFEPVVAHLESDRLATLGTAVEHGIGMGIPALAGVYAVQRALKPTVDDCCGWTYTVRPQDRRRKWVAIAILVVGPVPSFVLISSDLVPINPVTMFPIVLVLAAVASLVCLPLIGHPTVGSRDPTPSERRRLERCFERFDRSPGTLVVFDRALRDVAVFDAGRGSSRWTWVSESVLESATDDELGVLLAQATERSRRHQWGFTIAEFVLLVSGLTLFFNAFVFLELRGFSAPNVAIAVLSGLGIVGSVGSARAARRCSFLADEFASRQFGAETVRRTYLEYGSAIAYLDHDGNDGFLTRLMKGEPSPDARIDRLTERHSLAPLEDRPADEGDDADTDTVIPESNPSSGSAADATDAIVALQSMDQQAFTRFVADLRSAWNWECEIVAGDADSPADIVATDPSTAERALIRTIHRPKGSIVTGSELEDADELLARVRNGMADTVIFVTNARFDEDARNAAGERTLIDGDKLLELVDQAGTAVSLPEYMTT